MLISQKIFVAMLVWTAVATLISLYSGIEVMVTLIVIGLLIIREFTDGLLPRELKDRLDFFIYSGLFLFLVVVLRRVWLAVA